MRNLKQVNYTSLEEGIEYLAVHQEYSRGDEEINVYTFDGKRDLEEYILKTFGWVLEGEEDMEVTVENIFNFYLHDNEDEFLSIYEI